MPWRRIVAIAIPSADQWKQFFVFPNMRGGFTQAFPAEPT
jgi:hypothetical protein